MTTDQTTEQLAEAAEITALDAEALAIARAERDHAIAMLSEASQKIGEQRADLAEAAKVIEPFAREGARIDPGNGDLQQHYYCHGPLNSCFKDYPAEQMDWLMSQYTFGDLRRARAWLDKQEGRT